MELSDGESTPREQRWLAEHVEMSEARLSVLLGPAGVGSTSKYVDAICSALKIPPPEFADEREAEFIESARLVRKHEPAEFDRLAAKLTKLAAEIRSKRIV